MKEAMGLLEKAIKGLERYSEPPVIRAGPHPLRAVYDDLKKVYALLKQQPPAGDFTKEIQKRYGISLTIARDNPEKKQWEAERDLIKACDIIDTSEAREKDLLERLEKTTKYLEIRTKKQSKYSISRLVDKVIEANRTAIVKAKKEG